MPEEKINIERKDGKESVIKRIITGNDMVKVYLEDDRLSVSVEDYFKYDLKNRTSIDEDTLKELKENEKVLKAYQSCLRKLSLKDHTVKQIRDHLTRKELDPDSIEIIIKKLSDYDLLNDEKYCQSKITYYDNENLSFRQIRQKLKKDGISDEIIEKYLFRDEKRENDKIEKLVSKYTRNNRNKSYKSTKNAIISKLVNSGFSFSDSRDAVDNLHMDEKNELELLKKEYQKALTKYQKKYENYELKQKIMQNLLQKGFGYDDIKDVMEDGYE
ncbi:MAG: RecX family transcriptional regulator [Erysipelotrichaceae bacterium]|nr:RecX family transcriptional regulator [Erysipelotrichaceae bacterium]